MWSILPFCFIVLVSGHFLQNINDDYCIQYNNRFNSNRSSSKLCEKVNETITTDEYELKLGKSNLTLHWSHRNSTEWNLCRVTDKIAELVHLEILGTPNPEDTRFRQGWQYLSELGLEKAKSFELRLDHLLITERIVHYVDGPIELDIDFQGSENVYPINNYVTANSKRLRKLDLQGFRFQRPAICDNLVFFSSPKLQHGLEELSIHDQPKVDMKCFENYLSLKYIFFNGPYEPFENLTALICDPKWKYCDFTFGTNGLKCPEKCRCDIHDFFSLFIITCNFLGFSQIPPLPISIAGETELSFSMNKLTQLPNNSLIGYNVIKVLDVSDNKITSLAIHQLPKKLKRCVIFDNYIKIIGSDVADFFLGGVELLQTGIRWIVNCENRSLVKLLQLISYKYEVIFDQLNGTCPGKCKCCYDRNTDNFLINCSSQAVKYPELPSQIPNRVTLLLVNSSITEIPKDLSGSILFDNITFLDLRNNSLEALDEEVVDSISFQDTIKLKLSGNPWNCNCKAKSFLFFLKTRKPSEYTIALDRCHISMCPESCVCCFDSSESSALTVDCQGQRLQQLPLLPDSVTNLDLRNNNITEIDLPSQRFLSHKILSARLKVFLSGNPWTCTCENTELFAFAKNISLFIPDFSEMVCNNLGKRLALVDESDICPSYFIYNLFLIVFCIIMITAVNTLVYFKQPILVWFYEHEICLSMAVRLEMERMKKFDAFLSFTHKDENLVEEFVETLEKGQRRFRLCFYLRDWQVGASIPECIIRSVKDSRRIIILMTKNFVESTWGKLEFRLALHATSKDRCKRLIVILYPDVENFDDLDSELKAYMVLNTYLRRDSPNFWNKLIYSMPHFK